ncbi:MAG: BatD family protein, partial [Bacteroidetes bacterium]|nr:BatD family protein [Bacteroidota bacterium]
MENKYQSHQEGQDERRYFVPQHDKGAWCHAEARSISVYNILRIFTLLFLLLPTLSNAQKFTATANKTVVMENESFTVTWTFTEGSVYDFALPDNMNQFLRISGPYESNVQEIINGRRSGYTTLSVVLKAKKIGNFVLNPARITVNGRIIKSNSIPIKSVKDATAGVNGNASTYGKKNFILVGADKTSAVVGEPITVYYKLCISESGTASFNVTKNPQYNGFWVNNLSNEVDQNLDKEEVINGKKYG